MSDPYKVVRRLEDGQVLLIASRKDLEEARRLIESLRAEWPGDYSIGDACKSDIVRGPQESQWLHLGALWSGSP
jgi:hypothetical protein